VTVTLAASDSDQGSGQRTLDLTGVAEGDLIIVIGVHRTSTQSTTLSGTGWTETLVETEISDGDWRRAIVVAWKIADASPATSYTFQWSGSPTTVALGMVFHDSLGGTWGSDGVDQADNGTTEGQSIAAPTGDANANADGVAIGAIVLKSGEPDPATEVDPDAGYTTGPGDRSGTGQFDLEGVSAYEILTATGTQTTGFDWSDSAVDTVATLQTQVWSLTPSGVTGTAAGVLGGVTGSGSGVRGVTGTAAGVLGGVTGDAAGVRAGSGLAAGVFGGVTGSGSGVRGVTGAAAGAFGGVTGSAAGVRFGPGVGAGVLGGVAGEAAGVRRGLAAGAGVLGGVSGVAPGVRGVAGTASGVFGGVAGAAVGVRFGPGSASGVLGGVAGAGSGVRSVIGSGAGVFGGLVGAGAGVRGVAGAAAGVFGGLVGVAAGAAGQEPASVTAVVTSAGQVARVTSAGVEAAVSSAGVRARVSS